MIYVELTLKAFQIILQMTRMQLLLLQQLTHKRPINHFF